MWCILDFQTTHKEPVVTALPVHVPGSIHHQPYAYCNIPPEASISLFEWYFARPHGTFLTNDSTIEYFESLTYQEYFSSFRVGTFDITQAVNAHYFIEHHNSPPNISDAHNPADRPHVSCYPLAGSPAI